MDISLNILNLKYFTNNSGYTKLFHKEETTELYAKDDYLFYRKRILQLAKNIMRQKETDTTLVSAFNQFVQVSIPYLKFKDKSDILQDEFESISNNVERKNIIFPSNLEESNKLLFKQDVIHTKKIEDCMNIIRKTNKPSIPLPKQKQFNLKNPILKNKGVHINKKKKK